MNALTLWNNPFADVDSLIKRAFGPSWLDSKGVKPFAPAAEVVRHGDDALVKLELPGVDASKDVTIEVDSGCLTVRGERRDESSSDRSGRTLREVRYGSFERSFALPQHVPADAITASYDAGVLTVTVPGAYAGATPKRIAVTAAEPPAAVEAPSDAPAA